ncbi:MAG: TonB-dependent receptor [Betaproteobacteria bacterium]|nr:TonB-dependent receptor [Betaproteobacteria bacterium]
MQRKRIARALAPVFSAGAATLAATLLAPAAYAQGSPQALEKIEVTGSNIKRVDAEGPAPVQVITRQEIERSGYSTLADVMRFLPANSALAYEETFTGSFSRGSSGVSLRGLGQRATLTLINGRRMANMPFAQNLQDAFVDLNSIPLAAIDRIEVLKDGASAIYGSDALAGVVNIILRKDFAGLEGTAGHGRTKHGDGDETRASLAAGWGDLAKDKFNVIGVVDFLKRDTVWVRDRDWSRTADQSRFQGGTDLRSTISSPGNYARVPGTNPFPTARLPFSTCPADRLVVPAGSVLQCVEDTNQFPTLIPETDRFGFFTRLTWAFSPSLTGFAELGYNKTETFTQVAPFGTPSTQVGPGVARQINARLPVGNPSNPYTVPVDVRYRFDDVGPRQVDNNVEATRAVAGLKGNWGKWDWESALLYAKSEATQDDINGIRVSGLLSVIADGSYNFLNPAANSQAVYDRLRVNYQRRGETEIKQWDAKVTGELMEMANGPLAMAAGFETRKESLLDESDDVLASGDVLGRGSNRAKGSRTLTSGYVEFNIPVLRNLEVQAAGRLDHYSDFGSSTTPKVAFRWSPLKEFLVRGSWAKGFRAPNLVEAGDSAAFAFNTVVDTRRCEINSAYCPAGSVAAIIASGTDLVPEKSTSKNVGFVWDITRDLNLVVDAYDIKQKNIINTEGVQTILDGETTNPSYAARVIRTAPDAQDIARGAPGALVGVLNQFVNLTELHTQGVDLDLRWRLWKGDWGTYTLSSTNSYLHKYKTQVVREDPLTEYAGTYGLPRLRSIHSLLWDRGPWAATVAWNHVDDYDASTSAPPGAAKVGNWDTYDLQVSYTGFKNLKLTVGGRNILDRDPPIDLSSGTVPYDFSQHNPRGAYWYGLVSYRFK